MCLITNRIFPKYAWKDITVYKTLLPMAGEYCTPVVGEKVKTNSVIHNKKSIWWGLFEHRLTEEVVHAYTSLDIAIFEKGFSRDAVKAIIPRGTFYYVSDDEREIGSSKLFITDEVLAKAGKYGFECN